MRDFIRIVVLVINVMSELVVGALLIVAAIYEILGAVTFEKLTERLDIPWSMGLYAKVTFISLAILVISFFIRTKFFSASG